MFPVGAILDIGSKLIDRFLPDPEQKAKAQLELMKMQQDGELARMANDTELAKIYTADVDSARKREAEVATSDSAPYLNKIITPVLAASVLSMIFILFGFILFDKGLIDPTRKDILIYVLGVLSAIATQIVSYYFGSSQGSASKNSAIDKMLEKK
jgi:Holin of 3TMs, for gene-transfer release